MNPLQVFDESAGWRRSLARRYWLLPDVAAEVACECWHEIRSGETDQARLYWRVRRTVATRQARHLRPVVTAPVSWGDDAFDRMLEQVTAEQIIGTLATPPVEVDRLLDGGVLSLAERKRAQRWLQRQRRVLRARCAA